MQKQLHCEFCLWYSSQPNVKVAYGTKASCRWPNSSRAHLARGCLGLYLPTCQMTLSGEEPNKKNSLIFLLLRTQCFSHSSQPHLYSPNNHRFSALLKEKEKGGKKREREIERKTHNQQLHFSFLLNGIQVFWFYNLCVTTSELYLWELVRRPIKWKNI